MSFWEDSSPLVKVALIVGVLGLLYFGVAYFVGLPPFPGSCSYEADGQTMDGCPSDSSCVDGECVQNQRGI
ncbi:MAG: hypothetical protein AB7S26_09320 [Sandaracinaceae bacterium]